MEHNQVVGLEVFSSMLQDIITDSQMDVEVPGVASTTGAASSVAGAPEAKQLRTFRWSRAQAAAQQADQVMSNLASATQQLQSQQASVVAAMADMVQQNSARQVEAGARVDSTNADIKKLAELVKGAFGDNKLSGPLHRKIMTSSSLFSDRVARALRTTTKVDQQKKLVAELAAGRWPSSITAFKLQKETPEHSVAIVPEGPDFTLNVQLAGDNVKAAKKKIYDAITLLQTRLDILVLEEQMKLLKPKLTLDYFANEVSVHTNAPSSTVQKVSQKLGVDIPEDVAKIDPSITKFHVRKLYSAIMTSAGERVNAEESAINSAQKAEEARIKKLQEVTQEQLLDKLIAQKFHEHDKKNKNKHAGNYDPSVENDIQYTKAFVSSLTPGERNPKDFIASTEVDAARFYAANRGNQKKGKGKGNGAHSSADNAGFQPRNAKVKPKPKSAEPVAKAKAKAKAKPKKQASVPADQAGSSKGKGKGPGKASPQSGGKSGKKGAKSGGKGKGGKGK